MQAEQELADDVSSRQCKNGVGRCALYGDDGRLRLCHGFLRRGVLVLCSAAFELFFDNPQIK